MTPTDDNYKDVASKIYHHLKNNHKAIETAFLRDESGKGIRMTVTINLKVNPLDGKEVLPKTRFSFTPEKIVEVMEGRLPRQMWLDFSDKEKKAGSSPGLSQGAKQ